MDLLDPDTDVLIISQGNEHNASHSTGMHAHGRAQLLYAVHGVMRVRTHSGRWVVPSEQAVWIPSGIEHEVRCLNAVSMRSLYVLPDASTPTRARLPEECQVVDVGPLLREMIVRACQLSETGVHLPEGLTLAILEELVALRAAPLELPLPRDARLSIITDALRADPTDSTSLAEWGYQVGASERTLARLFKTQTGLGFSAWRQRLTAHVAIARLDSGASVTRVALDLGYSSPSSFVAMFRRVIGKSPARFMCGVGTASVPTRP